jgi:hypothetical protein
METNIINQKKENLLDATSVKIAKEKLCFAAS